MPKPIGRLLAAAALALLALAHPVRMVRAGDTAPPTGEGPRTVVKYATCAGGLAFAPSVNTAFAAFMVCLRMLMDEITT